MSGDDRQGMTPGTPSRAPSRMRRVGNALPGVLTWLLIIVALLGVAFFPGPWLVVVAVFLVLVVLRLAIQLALVLIGEYRVYHWSRSDWSEREDEPARASGLKAEDIRHVVLVATYREPASILRRTLHSLAEQHRAAERLVVVLAMEEREDGAREKGDQLSEEFAGDFLATLVTVHPADIPNEVPGKSSNEAWATARALELVADLGIDLDLTTLTSCDADSVLHPMYFAAVARCFVDDPKRYRRFWQSPLLYYNNVRTAPWPLRLDLVFMHSAQLAAIALPGVSSLPVSTFTLSMRLAADASWWDPAVISDDWHMWLRCFISTHGDVSTVGIYLPTWADIPYGPTLYKALWAKYRQMLRHSWGAEEVGYLLDELPGVRIPVLKSAAVFSFVLNDHVLRAVAWVLLTTGALGAWLVASSHDPSQVAYWTRLGPLLQGLFLTAMALYVGELAVELVRRSVSGAPTLTVLTETFGAWLFIPLIGIFSGSLPSMHAQTMLMLGRPLDFEVTPKDL